MKSMLLLFAWAATAAPSITLPIKAQIPPVAITSRPFHFQFAPTTFTSADGTGLAYKLSNSPTWLKLDSDTRTFTGLPQPSDLGSVTLQLIAVDDTGSIEQEVTLLVKESKDVHSPVDIDNQLTAYGSLTESNTLAYRTNEPFSITFRPDTFTGSTNKAYYALSSDHTPLPSWMVFDAQSLMFTGNTPPLIAIPQTFGFLLIASTVQGYSEASVTFFIVINDHKLAFRPYQQTIFLKKDHDISYDSLASHLFLDESSIARDDIRSVTATTPEWLKFNPRSLGFSGRTPSNLSSLEIKVRARDIYQDVADAILHIKSRTVESSYQLHNVTATAGTEFRYNVGQRISEKARESAQAGLKEAPSWIHLDRNSLVLYGRVPRKTPQRVVVVKVDIVLSSRNWTLKLQIHIKHQNGISGNSPRHSQGPGATSKPSPPHPNGSPGRMAPNKMDAHDLSVGSKVGIAIGSVVGFLAVIGLLCWRSTKRMKDRPKLAWRKLMAWRIRDSHDGKDDGKEKETDVEKNSAVSKSPLTSRIPQLGIGSVKHQRNSTSSFIKSFDQTTLRSFRQNSLGAKGMKRESTGLEAMPVITTTKAPEDEVVMQRKSKRASSHSAKRKSGLPNQRLLVGLGHGRASDSSFNRMSAQYRALSRSDSSAWSTIHSISNASSSIHEQIAKFPVTPRKSSKRQLHQAIYPRVLTVQEVSGSGQSSSQSTNSGIDSRTLEQRRQSYIRRRASSKHVNVLFGSDLGDTPSRQSSGKWLHLRPSSSTSRRLLQRSAIYRSKSSSVGVPTRAGNFPGVIQENLERNVEDLEHETTRPNSSVYSTEDEDDRDGAATVPPTQATASAYPKQSYRDYETSYTALPCVERLEQTETGQGLPGFQPTEVAAAPDRAEASPSGIHRLMSGDTPTSNPSSGAQSPRFL